MRMVGQGEQRLPKGEEQQVGAVRCSLNRPVGR